MVRATTTEGMETMVFGPLALDPAEPGVLTWLAKAGPYPVGSVRLMAEHAQIAVLRDLQFSSDQPHTRQGISAKLLSAVADYAREHGILKVKVHRNSRMDWVRQQLAHYGFADAASGRDQMQFYVDIYMPVRKKPHIATERREAMRMAC